MNDQNDQLRSAHSPCGVQGCLFGAVALFILLLVGLLIIAYFRFQQPPVPRTGAVDLGVEIQAPGGLPAPIPG